MTSEGGATVILGVSGLGKGALELGGKTQASVLGKPGPFWRESEWSREGPSGMCAEDKVFRVLRMSPQPLRPRSRLQQWQENPFQMQQKRAAFLALASP